MIQSSRECGKSWVQSMCTCTLGTHNNKAAIYFELQNFPNRVRKWVLTWHPTSMYCELGNLSRSTIDAPLRRRAWKITTPNQCLYYQWDLSVCTAMCMIMTETMVLHTGLWWLMRAPPSSSLSTVCRWPSVAAIIRGVEHSPVCNEEYTSGIVLHCG